MINRWRAPVLATALSVVAGVTLGAAATGEAPSPPTGPSVVAEVEADELRPENDRPDLAANAAAEAGPVRPDALTARLQDLRAELLTVADAIRAKEQTITDQQTRIETLAARQTQLLRGAAERRQKAAKVLFALQGVARVPPLAILARSNGPIDVVRSGVVLSTVVDELARRAETIRAESGRVARAQEAAAAERRSLASALEELHASRERLAVVIGEAVEVGQRLQDTLHGDDGRVPELIADTENLTAALTGLTAAGAENRQPAPPLPSEDASAPPAHRAALAPLPRVPGLPVAGRIVVNFGDLPEEDAPDGDASYGGAASKGVRIETPPGAQVLAPSSGRVAFVGPFRGYGLLLIVEHGDGYHSLMAGFDRIDLNLDQQIDAGDPIGVMGGAAGTPQSLYIELRHEGQPVNPLPWFVQVNGKANG